MIAKLIVWGKDRKQALALLSNALEKTYIVGVDTNVSFLYQITKNKDFQKEKISTNFINNHPELQPKNEMLSDEVIVLAALTQLHAQQQVGQELATRCEDTFSPWFIRDNWRLMKQAPFSLSFWFGHQTIKLDVSGADNHYVMHFPNRDIDVSCKWQNDHKLNAIINKKIVQITAIKYEDHIHIFQHGQHFILKLFNPTLANNEKNSTNNRVTAPMPGTIIEIFVRPGQKVAQGDRLITLEAMKMEHTITAPAAGMIKSICYKTGDLIHEGVELLEFNVENC